MTDPYQEALSLLAYSVREAAGVLYAMADGIIERLKLRPPGEKELGRKKKRGKMLNLSPMERERRRALGRKLGAASKQRAAKREREREQKASADHCAEMAQQYEQQEEHRTEW